MFGSLFENLNELRLLELSNLYKWSGTVVRIKSAHGTHARTHRIHLNESVQCIVWSNIGLVYICIYKSNHGQFRTPAVTTHTLNEKTWLQTEDFILNWKPNKWMNCWMLKYVNIYSWNWAAFCMKKKPASSLYFDTPNPTHLTWKSVENHSMTLMVKSCNSHLVRLFSVL